MTWDGDEYQARFDQLAADGAEVHGEADLVSLLAGGPTSVLDAGCGTGRVGIELARRGFDVVGVDLDASMLATARRQAPELTWVEADLATLDLDQTFPMVVLAGNVPLFTPSGTLGSLLARCAAHLQPGGALVAGFSLGRGVDLATWDGHAARAGLVLADRYATWDRRPFADGDDYAVSVHRLDR